MDSDARALMPPIFRFASKSTDDDAEIGRFLRRRLQVHLWVMAAIFGGLYLVGVVGLAIVMPSHFLAVHRHPAKILNAVAPLFLLGIREWVRRGQRSVLAMRICDFGAELGIGLALGVMVATAPTGYRFELVGMFMLVFTLVLRAALVPSTVPWTGAVGLICAIPVIVGGYVQAQRSPPNDWVTPPMVAVGLSAWCIASTSASAVVSRVIYGLITQVREAMYLGRYTLLEQIGEGGMGAVYRAEHAMLRRPTAIKLLLPGRVSAEALARFEREVQLTSRLSHPNTVAIYDYGRTPEHIFYYAMEYLDGVSLEDLVAEDGPQDEGRIVHILGQVAGALAEAHGIGLIHRDIKPANIMLCERGGMPDVAKVVDFGLVKKIEGASDQVALTMTNAIAGTPLYMSPEAITRPDEIDGRADLYALAAVGYYLLTGGPPFTGKTIVEVCGQHLHTPPDPPSLRLGRDVSPKLESLLLACLAKSPAHRPRDAGELMALLAECEGERHWSARQAKDWWSRWRARAAKSQETRGLPFQSTVSRDVA